MILNFTKDDDDIKFLCYAIDSNAVFKRASELSLENNGEVFTGIEAVAERIFVLNGESSTRKAIEEFKKARAMPRPIPSIVNTLSLLNYINIVKQMLVVGTLKNKAFIDEFTKLLGFAFDPDFYLLEIKTGRIQSIEAVEGMDKIFREQVVSDRGYTICSGLREHYRAEDLANKTCLFVLNIKPIKFRGTVSEGMICCTKDEGKVEVLGVDCDANTRLIVENEPVLFEDLAYGKVDISKAKYQGALEGFRIVDNHLTFKGRRLTCSGAPIVTAIKNGPVS